jgi:hypothetical protein
MYQQQQEEELIEQAVTRLLEAEELVHREKQVILDEWNRQHEEWSRRVQALEQRCEMLERQLKLERQAFAEEIVRLADTQHK